MIRFDHPALLLLALVAVPVVALGWPMLRTVDPLRRTTVLGLRTVVILAVAVTLAGPRRVREHDHLTVIGVLISDIALAILDPRIRLSGGATK